MAGRKAHIQTDETFDQFIQSIPEDARGRGYWKIRLERTPSTGGLMQVICGFLEFQPGEGYDSLRSRIKNSFADNRGPGVYFATPCDQEKKEIKNLDKARFEYKEGEVEMPENIVPEASPLGDALKNVRKMSTDMAALQKMKLEQQFMEKALGIEKKEEDTVKEPAANSGMGVNDILMWKTFLDNGEKKTPAADSVVQQQLSEMKMEKLLNERVEKAIGDLKAVVQPKEDSKLEKLLEKLIEAQAQPKEDKVEKLLERLLTKDDDSKREDIRREERRREDERAADEKRRWEAEIKQREEERKEERRRYEDEIKRKESERLAEDRRRDEDRQKEERRRDDERKEERKRLEESARLERDKYERELAEQRRRFDEEAKLRREEIKSDDVRTRQYSAEQQKFQLQLLDIFKNNKDSGLEMTSKVVESLTAAGMSSMKTAQDAAESIMDIARSANPRKEKEGMDGKGFMDNIKDIAQLAAPFFTPYADADAKIKVIQAASKLSGASLNTPGISDIMGGGGKKAPKGPAAPPPVPGGYTKADIDQAVDAFTKATGIKPSQAEIEAAMAAFGMSGVAGPPPAAAPAAPPAAAAAPRPAPVATPGGAPNPTGTTPQASAAPASKSPYGGLASMIAQYLKAYPILKHALIGNLRDKIGVRSFMPVVTGLNQPTLEGLLANVPHQVVMGEIKQVCSEDEQKLIDENEAWFSLFRKEMIEVIKESEEDEDEESSPIKLPAEPLKK
jgi:hypothetical protein